MPKATDEEQRFYQNLVDIGCGKETIQYCTQLKKEGRLRELLLTLQKQRRKLLNSVHAGQRQVDCLDYLANQIEKQQTTHETR